MVMPLGPMNNMMQMECPRSVKDRYAKWWWAAVGMFGLLCIGRFVALDIMGGILSLMMAIICGWMVSNDCQRLSQYCILMFGFLCTMNFVLELVTVCQVLQMGGRSTQSRAATTTGAASKNPVTSITVTIHRHNFFDENMGVIYNHQSAMMIASPIVAFLGAVLCYFCYNAFPTSLFEEGEDNDAEEARMPLGGGGARNFGGGTLGGNTFGGGGSARGGGGSNNGNSFRAFNGSRGGPPIFEGQGQRLGSG